MKVYIALYDGYTYKKYAVSWDCLGIFDSQEKAQAAIKKAGVETYRPYIEEFELNEINHRRFGSYVE